MKISTVHRRQILGLEDIIHSFKERFTSAQVISDKADILVINFESLIKNLPNEEENPRKSHEKELTTREILKNYSMKKIDFLSQRVECVISGESELETKTIKVLPINKLRDKPKEAGCGSVKNFKHEEEKEFVKQLQSINTDGLWNYTHKKRSLNRRSSDIVDRNQQKTSFYKQLIKEETRGFGKRSSSMPELYSPNPDIKPDSKYLKSHFNGFSNTKQSTLKNQLSKRSTRNEDSEVMNMHIRSLEHKNSPFLQSSLKGRTYDLERMHIQSVVSTTNTISKQQIIPRYTHIPFKSSALGPLQPNSCIIRSLKKPRIIPNAQLRFFRKTVKKEPMRKLSIEG